MSAEIHLRRNRLPLCNFQKQWRSCDVTSTAAIASVTCGNCRRIFGAEIKEAAAERALPTIDVKNRYGPNGRGKSNG